MLTEIIAVAVGIWLAEVGTHFFKRLTQEPHDLWDKR